MASPALVVGMQDNEYTDAQGGDARGLFKSLDPAPCGAVPAYLIQCSSSNLPDPVLWFQSTSSSASDPVYTSSTATVPVYLIQYYGSKQSASSTAPVPVYLIHYSSPEDFNFSLISCIYFIFVQFFLSNLNNNRYNYFLCFYFVM